MNRAKERKELIQRGICYLCKKHKIETGGYCLCLPCYEEYIAKNR